MAAANKSDLRSPLRRARGLGSAKDGTNHWWAQRVTAVALVPLALWFVWSVLKVAPAGIDGYRIWIASPFNATAMIVFLGVTFHHAQLGLQVVFEDYVGGHGARIVTNMIVKFLCYGLAALSIVSVLIVAFGG
jgi:succinate dehydrogenase / fumarate reductase membrane anchor subunit